MKLVLKRRWFTRESTIGELFIDGAFECFVLEDRYRPPPEPKVPAQTAIPVGRYEVEITDSPKFKRLLPLVKNVPGFTGIRIHPGNKKDDTEGCLLPGQKRGLDEVTGSVLAFNALYTKLADAQNRHEPVTLEITLEPVKS